MSNTPNVHFYIKGRKGTQWEGQYLQENVCSPPRFVLLRSNATWFKDRSYGWALIERWHKNDESSFQLVAVRKKLFLRNNSPCLHSYFTRKWRFGDTNVDWCPQCGGMRIENEWMVPEYITGPVDNNLVPLTTHQCAQVQYGAEEYKKTGNLKPLLLLMKYAVRVTPIETTAHSGTLLRLIDAAKAVKITQGKNAIALDELYKAALAYEP